MLVVTPATGFTAFATDSATVTVSQPAITLADNTFGDQRIGGGLQARYILSLGASAHGGVTVRVASSDTFRILLAPDVSTAGTAFIDLFVPDGSTNATFYVQGISGVTGNVTLTATNSQFATDTLNVELVQGVISINSLLTTNSAGAADDPFRVRTGYIHSNGSTFRSVGVSAGDAPLQVLVSSSNVAVGEVNTLVENGASVTVEVAATQSFSPSTVAAGGVAFDSIAAGTTNISVSAIGFDNSWSGSVVTVTVNP